MANERRRCPRVRVQVSAEVSILLPEETFRPLVQNAMVTDLSERGLMVTMHLESEVYRELLRKPRYCRVHLKEPDLPDRVVGKAVWIEPVSGIGEISFNVGISFEETPDEVLEKLRVFIGRQIELTQQ